MRQDRWFNITKATFTTEPRYFSEGIEEESETKEPAKSWTSKNKRKHLPDCNDKGNKKRLCWICEGWYRSESCLLTLGVELKRVKIHNENKEIFEKKIKELAFAKKIQQIQDHKKKKKELMTE